MSIEEEGGNFNFFTISIFKYKIKKIVSYKLLYTETVFDLKTYFSLVAFVLDSNTL